MKICTTCGTDNGEDLDICGVCGTPLFASAVFADESEAAPEEAEAAAESAPLATAPSDTNSLDDLVAIADDGDLSEDELIAVSEDGGAEEDLPAEASLSGGMDSLMRAQALLMGKPTELEEDIDTASVDETEAELLKYQESIQISVEPDLKPEPEPPLTEAAPEPEEEAAAEPEEEVMALEEEEGVPSLDEEELLSVEVIAVAKPEIEEPLQNPATDAEEGDLENTGPESIVASLLEETIAEDSVITQLSDAQEPVSIDDGKPETPQIVQREVKRGGPPVLLILLVLAVLGAAAAGAVYFFVIK